MDSTGKIGARLSLLDTDAVYLKKSGQTENQAAEAKTAALKRALEGGSFGEDTVNLSLSQAIQAAFGDDSEARKKRVAELKAQVEKGEYVPNTALVAKELATEIAQSVYFGPQTKGKDDAPLF